MPTARKQKQYRPHRMTEADKEAWDIASETISSPDYEAAWVHCRASRHHFIEDAITERGPLLYISTVCSHECGSTQDRIEDHNGFTVYTAPIKYPKGYQMRGTGRARTAVRAAARIEYIGLRRRQLRKRAVTK